MKSGTININLKMIIVVQQTLMAAFCEVNPGT
jgi:hypothetical protein